MTTIRYRAGDRPVVTIEGPQWSDATEEFRLVSINPTTAVVRSPSYVGALAFDADHVRVASDAYPWRVEIKDRTALELIAARDGERITHPGWITFWDAKTERLIFDPRIDEKNGAQSMTTPETVNPISKTTPTEDAILDGLRTIKSWGPAGGPILLKLASDLEQMLKSAEFPAITVTREFDHDEEDFVVVLRCPTCGNIVTPGSISAVDSALRWTEAEDMDFEDQEFRFSFGDEGADFGDSTHYLHNQGHPVALPEGWTEA